MTIQKQTPNEALNGALSDAQIEARIALNDALTAPADDTTERDRFYVGPEYHVETRQIELTQSYAEWLIDNCQYHGQRVEKRTHVDMLSHEMLRQKFFSVSEEIILVNCNGKLYQTDGRQRTLAFIQLCKGDPEKNIPAHPHARMATTLKVVYVDTEDEVANIYTHLDAGRKRTLSDALKTLDIHTKMGLKKPVYVNLLGAAAKAIETGFTLAGTDGYILVEGSSMQKAMSLTDKTELIHKWGPEGIWFFENVLESCNSMTAKAVRKPFVMGMALLTYSYQPEKAESFWVDMVKDDGLMANDTRKILLNRLLARIGTRENAAEVPFIVGRAWNAWFKGVPLSDRFTINTGRTLPIAGCDPAAVLTKGDSSLFGSGVPKKI